MSSRTQALEEIAELTAYAVAAIEADPEATATATVVATAIEARQPLVDKVEQCPDPIEPGDIELLQQIAANDKSLTTWCQQRQGEVAALLRRRTTRPAPPAAAPRMVSDHA